MYWQKKYKEVNKICNIWAEETKRLRCRDQFSDCALIDTIRKMLKIHSKING